MKAQDIHTAIDWRVMLERLGVDSAALTGRHAPCPGCGGRDRFRFDDRDGRGTWICSRGSGEPLAGDGFQLLKHVFGWDFREARERVLEAIGGQPTSPALATPSPRSEARRDEPAQPSRRVRDLMRTFTAPESVEDVVAYLRARGVWPLPSVCELRGHPGAPYFEDGVRVGLYPALLAPVRDLYGELVTLHVTYLHNGRKLDRDPARKILGPMHGRRGCAVRLAPVENDTLGLAEGIETAVAAMRLHGTPTWAALSARMLEKFEPPQGVHRVIVYADRDPAGLEAAWKLRDCLEGQAVVELATPPAPHADWNDVLVAGSAL